MRIKERLGKDEAYLDKSYKNSRVKVTRVYKHSRDKSYKHLRDKSYKLIN
jgi:hypothetical protein